MFNYPLLTTTKSLSAPKIDKKEWTKVTLSVYGDTRPQTSKVPVSLVLALDYSSSMEQDNAYQEVSAAAKMILGQLTPGTDSVAIITIRTTATLAVPLTSNFAGLAQTIDGFGADGYTNLQGAFDQANAVLVGAVTPNRAVILLSDGFPANPDVGIDWQQINYLNSHWQQAAANNIHYHTIGYGPLLNEMLLQFLATKTGGSFQKAPTKQNLKTTFATALAASTSQLSTTNVTIREAVSKALRIRPNSVAKSLTSELDDPVKFDADFAAAAQAFYSTGVLEVPKIIALPAGQMFSLSFEVTSDQCAAKPLFIPVDDLGPTSAGVPAAHVQYSCGKPALAVDPLAQATLEVNPWGVEIDKEFDEKTLTVSLKLRNNYPRAIRQARLIENASPYFTIGAPVEPKPAHLSPAVAQWLMDQVAGDSESRFTLHFEDSAQQAAALPPYPVDGKDTSLAFCVEDYQFEILVNDAIYATFATDLQNLAASAATQQFFANYPDPDFRFSLEGPISTATVDPDFGWAMAAKIVHYSYAPEPQVHWNEPVQLFVKKTATGYAIYRTVFKSAKPPQRYTSANYGQP